MKADLVRYVIIMVLILSVSSNQEIKSVEKGYMDEDVSMLFSIVREPESKKVFLHVDKPVEWSVYSGSSIETIDLFTPVRKGTNAGVYELPVNNEGRIYFQIVTPGDSVLIAERHLPMEGGFNFRDLGGYQTISGKSVKWGKVFRSDELNMLTSSDLEYLSSIPLCTIIDFRSESEMKHAPDKKASSVLYTYDLSISPGNLTNRDSLENLDYKNGEDMMKKINRMFVTDSAIIAQYQTFFELLQDETKTPLIFHCTAGKDRTGMGAALFLAALGVDEDIIFADYLLSNQYLKEKYRSVIQGRPQLQALFEVRPEYLRAGFNQIKEDHGSVENYLTQILHVDLEKMKDIYLEK